MEANPYSNMTKFLFFGDWHLTDKENGLFFNGHLKLMKWVEERYDPSNTILLFSGDVFHKVIINYDNVKTPFVNWLLKFKAIHIIEGNHDRKKDIGSPLTEIGLHSNITIYKEEVLNVNIEGYTFDFFPFLKEDPSSMIRYEDYTGNADFGIIHAHPKGYNRGIEEITLKRKYKHGLFYGHYHRPDQVTKNSWTIGVPQTTRNGEQDWAKRMFVFDGSKLESVELPVYFNIGTIQYGEEIVNKDWIYNIENAPSMVSINDKYKGVTLNRCKVSIKESINDKVLDHKIQSETNDWHITYEQCIEHRGQALREDVHKKVMSIL